MRFQGFFYPLAAVLSLAGSMMAADPAARTAPQTGVVRGDGFTLPTRSFFAPPQSSELKPGTPEPFTRPDQSGRYQFRVSHVMRLHPSVIDPNLCYTMRTYMMKPSERFANGESGFRGYSSCQLASSYRIRSADAQEQTGAKLK